MRNTLEHLRREYAAVWLRHDQLRVRKYKLLRQIHELDPVIAKSLGYRQQKEWANPDLRKLSQKIADLQEVRKRLKEKQKQESLAIGPCEA